MKRTYIFRTVLLMITMAIFHTAPAYASTSIMGSVDIFNGSQISGWVYESANPLSTPEIQLRITNSLTGETVKEVSAVPSYTRDDLNDHLGTNGTPAYTSSIDLNTLPDGIYSAAAYKDGKQFSNTAYYTKGDAAQAAKIVQPLGSFRLTAYCPCNICSEGWGRHTSSGAIAQANHTVAVDPRIIPIGSKLLINGTVYTAEDIGGAVKGNHIDVFFDTHAQTKQFGSQNGEVFLLK